MSASWNRIGRWIGIAVWASVGMAGCSSDPAGVSSPTVRDEFVASLVPSTAFVAEEVTINHYIVRFDGRTVSGGNTTFTYNVRGTGVDPALSHFTIELPACAGAPVSYSPTSGANINTNGQSGIYGIEWHLSVSKDNTVGRTYSVTFPGDVALGIVRSEVKTEGGARGVGTVYGPCAGSHISGTVFVDADNNSIQAASEGGIENVTVTISNGTASVSAVTDAAGDYSFVVTTGTYTVSVEPTTAASDFNEDLFATFTVVSATSQSVTVGPDASNIDFAFDAKSDKVVADLSSGVLVTTGKPVRFWKTQLRNAQTGKGTITYTAAQLTSFLQQVEGLGIAVPFEFGTGTEISEALAILSDNGKDVLVQLKRELLASELNFVSGNTLVGQEDLHEVLITWGEELLMQPTPAPAPGSIIPMVGRTYSEAQGAVGMFGVMNGSTGGGGTED